MSNMFYISYGHVTDLHLIQPPSKPQSWEAFTFLQMFFVVLKYFNKDATLHSYIIIVERQLWHDPHFLKRAVDFYIIPHIFVACQSNYSSGKLMLYHHWAVCHIPEYIDIPFHTLLLNLNFKHNRHTLIAFITRRHANEHLTRQWMRVRHSESRYCGRNDVGNNVCYGVCYQLHPSPVFSFLIGNKTVI